MVSFTLTGISNKRFYGAAIYQADHIKEIKDGGDSDEENCQLLNIISHAIKTNSNETYTSLIKSPESIAKFRTDILLDIIKNSKQGNIPLDREELSKALWS